MHGPFTATPTVSRYQSRARLPISHRAFAMGLFAYWGGWFTGSRMPRLNALSCLFRTVRFEKANLIGFEMGMEEVAEAYWLSCSL